MNIKKVKKVVILIFLIILTCNIFYVNSDKYKLEKLYINPIKVNQSYKEYTYNEYDNHVTILTYNGFDNIVIIPEHIKNKPVYAIDDSAFYGNRYLEKVVIPNSVIRIGHQSFIGCGKLQEVTLPKNIIDLGEWSFKGCTNLKKINVKKESKTDKVLKKTSFKKYINYKD